VFQVSYFATSDPFIVLSFVYFRYEQQNSFDEGYFVVFGSYNDTLSTTDIM
jgi:hypothetical protein